MADFLKAYKKTAKTEGGYVNDSTDRGGETWKGISRKHNSKWKGWAIIDGTKKSIAFPAKPSKKTIEILNGILYKNKQLSLLEKDLYKWKYWDAFRGDEIAIQLVADFIYDSSVNMGPRTAIKLAQRSLDVAETGKVDDYTLNRLNNDV